MGLVSELIVSVGVEGTQDVVDALKKVDGAQVELKDKTSSSTQSMKASWSDWTTGLNQGLQLVRTAIDGVKMAFDLVNDYSDYNLAMNQGSIATGMMVDEYSRLIQAADDAYVSQDAFVKSIEMATRNGYPITIDSLGQIADKLNAIKDPSEKAKLAMDIFGRGWADIMPFLEQGSTGIDKATGAIKDNLIATEESIAKSKAFATATDDFNDAWTGVKNTVAGMAMPELTKTLNDFTSFTELKSKVNELVKAGTIEQKEYNKALWESKPSEALLGLYNEHIQEYTQSLGMTTAAGNEFMQTLFDSSDTWADFSEGAKQAGIDLGMMNEEFFNSEKAAAAASGATADVTKTAEELQKELEQILQVQADLANATSLTTWFGGIIGLAKNYTTALEEITKQEEIMANNAPWTKVYKDAEQAKAGLVKGMADMANQMTLDMFQATIAIGGITEAEMGAYLDMAIAFGLISQDGADAAVEAYNNGIRAINDLTIDEKTANVVVDAAAAYAAFDLLEQYAFAPKVVKVQMKLVAEGMSAGPWGQEEGPTKAIGGPVYPGNVYNWQEPGREGEILMPSQYGRVASSTEVAQMLREATRPGDGASAGKQAQIVNNNTTEVVVNATVASDFDLDKLTREIVRKINA